MSNKVILIISIFLCLVVAVFCYLWFTTPIVSPVQTESQKEVEIAKLKKSFLSGSPSHCVINEPSVQTTYIIDGKKSFTKTVNKNENGKEFTIYTINNGKEIYSWNNANNSGILVHLTDTSAEIDSFTEEDARLSLPRSINYGIRCITKAVDSSFFNPPSDKEFKTTTTTNTQRVP